MRVSVHGRRFAVSGPSGVGYSDRTGDILVAAIVDKVVHLALCLAHIQFSCVIYQRHASAVIPTILQPSESLYQYRESLFVTYIALRFRTYIIIYNTYRDRNNPTLLCLRFIN